MFYHIFRNVVYSHKNCIVRVHIIVANLDYYYVPTIYMGGRKLYEAHPSDDYDKIRRSVKAALDEAL